MRLHTLILKDFQGVKSLTLEFNGKNAAIYGDNATGKSTIVNAYTWLLFGKPATDAKNFTPKTRTAEGEAHGLEHSVTACFEDGEHRLELCKIFKEIYKKKRGSIREEFDGHTTEFFVDGVPVKEKEYAETVGKLWRGNAELAKILTIPTFFSEALPWEKRRTVLLEMCGDVTDADVFAQKDELAALNEALGGRTVDAFHTMQTARRRTINERLGEMPGRLDEAQRAVAAIPSESREELAALEGRLEEEKAELFAQRQAAAGSVVEEKRAEVARIRAEMREAEAGYRERCAATSSVAREHLASLREKAEELGAQRGVMLRKLSDAKSRKERLETQRRDLLSEYAKISSLVWDESEGVCPCCQRPFPEEDVQKMKSDFNLRKSVSLSEINARGKAECSREMIDRETEEILRLEAELSELGKKIEAADAEIEKTKSLIPSYAPFAESEECAAFASRIAEAERSVHDADKNAVEAMGAFNDRILIKNEELRAVREKIAALSAAERQRARVAELENEQKELARAYEDAERMIWLCELFTRTKVSMLTERINGRFKTVRFSLFADQINGGIKEECEVLVPSEDGALVPFAFANTAARINAGIEIIEAASEHYGVLLPLFVDNAESVTHLHGGTAQQIRLIVSAEDKTLRLEVAPC